MTNRPASAMNPALAQARLLTFAVPAALLAGAYISQYGFGLFPCEMCWWQRYAHFAALALILPAFALKRSRSLVLLAALAVLASGLIGAFHAGVEYHWWQGITRCSRLVPLEGNALDAIMHAPSIRCDQAQWTLAGVSLAGFNFLFSTAGALWALIILRKA